MGGTNVGIDINVTGGEKAKREFGKASDADKKLREGMQRSKRSADELGQSTDKLGQKQEQQGLKAWRALQRQKQAELALQKRAQQSLQLQKKRALAEQERAKASLARQRQEAQAAEMTKRWEDEQRRAATWQRGWNQARVDALARVGLYERRAAAETRTHRRELERLGMAGRVAGGALRSLAGMAAGVGVGMALSRSVSSARESLARQVEFEREITPLASMGDNVRNLGELRRGVAAESTAWGLPTSAIAQYRFNVQSTASNLDEDTRKGIERGALVTAKLTGEDLGEIARAGTKMWQIYGDEIGSVATMWGKLNLTAEEGVVDMTDLSRLMPDVAASARAVGITFDELAASIMAATQVGGKTEKTFTGLRNIYLRMVEAQEKGYEFRGSLAQKIQQINAMSPEEKIEVFGAQAISVAQSISQDPHRYNAYLAKIRELRGNYAEGKLLGKMADPTALYADLSGSIEQSMANVPLSDKRSGNLRMMDTFYQVSKRGYMESTPSFLHWLAPAAAGLEMLKMPFDRSRYFERGRLALQQEFTAGGRASMGNALFQGPQENAEYFRGLASERGFPMEPAMSSLRNAVTDQTFATRGNTAALLGRPVPEGSFASGTDYVPRDMVARIHRGERIVPASENYTLNRQSSGVPLVAPRFVGPQVRKTVTTPVRLTPVTTTPLWGSGAVQSVWGSGAVNSVWGGGGAPAAPRGDGRPFTVMGGGGGAAHLKEGPEMLRVLQEIAANTRPRAAGRQLARARYAGGE